MKKILSISFLLIFISLTSISSYAQCAMCRATVENNVSNGKPGIGAGLNTGIFYLLSMPYLAAITLGILWYRSSISNDKKNIHSSLASR